MVEGLGEPSNKSCIFRNKTPYLVTFYEDQQVTEDVVHFPPGTELVTPAHSHLARINPFTSTDSHYHPTDRCQSIKRDWLSDSCCDLEGMLAFHSRFSSERNQLWIYWWFRRPGAWISANTPSLDRSVDAAVVASGPAWNLCVTDSAKRTTTPVINLQIQWLSAKSRPMPSSVSHFSNLGPRLNHPNDWSSILITFNP